MSTSRDVTDRKRTEEELVRRAEELARSNAELDQFAFVASHDLQEPLRVVSTFMQRLAGEYRDRLDERANEYVRFALDAAHRMRDLVSR